MKQLSNKMICKYCLGCKKLAEEEFEGYRYAKCFVPAYPKKEENNVRL